ncbi:MAG: DUF11 domain-containing protein [Victivallales bacterium]|nr:DUF11 domain-containing protein [Victivallales bacterium]MCF7888783.1 DUF11 domain-containing protein [Victivallales bacterium]
MTKKNLSGRLITLLTSIAVCICFTSCKTTQQAKPKESKFAYAWLGFPQPAPTPEQSKILVEKWTPKKSKPGETVPVKLKIQNNADYKISHSSIMEKLPPEFKIVKIIPRPEKESNNRIKWNLVNIAPGTSKTFIVKGKINKVGSVRYTGKTVLNFESSPMGSTENSVVKVIAPDLELNTVAPNTSVINSIIPVELTFKNRGTAPVEKLKLFQTLPRGILTYSGKSNIQLDIGTLSPQQEVTKNIDMKGTLTGDYNIKLTAVADNNIEDTSSINLKITEPQLKIKLIAPNKRFVGDVIPYTVKLKNTGNADAANAVVQLELPDGISLASIDNNGTNKDNIVKWNIGTLHPNETKTLSAKVVANRIMTARTSVTADADASEKIETARTTDVAGIAALLCSLDDIHDPVPVGEIEEYILTVKNQGSLPATKIKVECFIEDSMQYIESTGATKANLKNNLLTFDPLPELGPQAEAKWKIKIKALKPGSTRFKAEVTSEQLTKEVTKTEPTYFYE